MIEKTRTYTVASVKKKFLGCSMQRETCHLGKKAEDGKNSFFKALVNTFWLIPSCFWFNKVVNGQPSIKWTS